MRRRRRSPPASGRACWPTRLKRFQRERQPLGNDPRPLLTALKDLHLTQIKKGGVPYIQAT